MLWTISVMSFALWFLAVATPYTFGGFIHILLLLAFVTVLIRLIRRRRIVS
jgi:hypothetical protein